MPANRSHDWWRQDLHDQDAGRRNAELAIHDWACFMAQQTSEKALKALLQRFGGDARGHSLRELARLVPPEILLPENVADAFPMLDRYYTPLQSLRIVKLIVHLWFAFTVLSAYPLFTVTRPLVVVFRRMSRRRQRLRRRGCPKCGTI